MVARAANAERFTGKAGSSLELIMPTGLKAGRMVVIVVTMESQPVEPAVNVSTAVPAWAGSHVSSFIVTSIAEIRVVLVVTIESQPVEAVSVSISVPAAA